MVAEADKSALTIAAISEGSFKKITVQELNDLGYEITGRQIFVGSRPYKYGIMEVKEENTKHIMITNANSFGRDGRFVIHPHGHIATPPRS